MHEDEGQRTASVVIAQTVSTFFFRQCLSLAWYLSNRLHRLAKSQESACYTPLSGWDFKPMPPWALGMEPGPHACRAGTLPTKLTLPPCPTHSHPPPPQAGLELSSLPDSASLFYLDTEIRSQLA